MLYTYPPFLFRVKSPFNGEDEDELFEAICSDEPQYPRWLNKHTLNLIDRVSGDGKKWNATHTYVLHVHMCLSISCIVTWGAPVSNL